ncbi:hypothetical protein ACFV1L_21835 [Kitasatospora sp. NPDC059646]|uniref:hypothetical protein n=1 Tax=Kitasatospora sp. NPDC059646 TaxID=3346893 RepID=UPI00367F6940
MSTQRRIHQPATARTAPLTAAMQAALTTIRAGRNESSGNGISLPTIEALAAAGEIVLVHTWQVVDGRRSLSRTAWTAYPAPMPSAAPDAIRILRRWHEQTSLHLGCDCALDGRELHAAYRAEQLAEAVAEAQRLAAGNGMPVHVCTLAPAGHTPAPGQQRSAAALATEQRLATPALALARTLKRLDLQQGRGRDFRIMGHYNGHGERLYTWALVLSDRAEAAIAEHADRIEAELALAGFPFTVSVRYVAGRPTTRVANGTAERVRENAPAPAVEDVLAATAAASLTLHTAGAPAAQDDDAEHPAEPVRTDRNGTALTTNARVLLHGTTGRPGRGIVAGWAPTGEVLVGLAGRFVRVADPARIEIDTVPAITEAEYRELLAQAHAEEPALGR